MTDDTQPTLQYYDLYREPTAPIRRLSDAERRILRGVSQKLGTLPTLEDVIDLVFERTQSLFPCDRLGVSFLEEDGRRHVSRYNRATYEHLLLDRGYAEDIRGSSLADVVRRGTPRVIGDLQIYADERPNSRSARLLVREGVRASLTVPLVVEGRVIGFLYRSSRRPWVYSQHHVLLQLSLSEQIGWVVEKTWRIEQLTAANHAYMEMLGFVSHELKSPVASMVTDARLLADGYLGPLDEAQKAKLERLITKGEYLLDIVREYLDLARVEGDQLHLEMQCDLPYAEAVVEPAVEVVRPQLEEHGMKLVTHLPSDPPLRTDCDPALLRIVLVNLLANAVRYGREGGTVRLSVETPPGHVRTSVWNEGPGFSRRQRTRLFRKFSRLGTPTTDGRHGTGLGLYNSWRIVQLHNGHIKADSEPGEWAEFTFDFPQPLCGDESPDPATGDQP